MKREIRDNLIQLPISQMRKVIMKNRSILTKLGKKSGSKPDFIQNGGLSQMCHITIPNCSRMKGQNLFHYFPAQT